MGGLDKSSFIDFREPQYSGWGVLWVFLVPGLGGLLYGYDIGATSFVLTSLIEEADDEGCWWGTNLDNVSEGLIVSAISLGALFGSHMTLVGDFGRRMELRLAAVLYCIGTLLNVISGSALKESNRGLWCLILGRWIFGMGVGFVMRMYPWWPSHA